jgi:3-dehydroquinate synthase
MEKQKVILSEQLQQTLSEAVAECERDHIFILTDETTRQLCLPLVAGLECLSGAKVITIGATDQHKNLESLAHVWTELQSGGATRHSLMVNLGGGMVTDLGGFAASTFKRGLNYINIPTTLLAMVDASVGGKTGINFGGLKNEVGVFSNARSVILDTVFLRTLDMDNILSGYAEMLKHGLIANDDMLAELLNFNLDSSFFILDSSFPQMLAKSVAVKERIVEEDPTEQGIRKALNLGHTVGHAFESLALKRSLSPLSPQSSPLLHGYAVAFGLICELYLCCIKTGFPTDRMRQTVRFIRENYGQMAITCDDYPVLLELMTHDKKNTAGVINFTLLGGVGDIRINQTATQQEIYEALDFYREGSL